MDGSPLLPIVVLTLKVSGIALAIDALLGIPAGALLALTSFRGRRLIEAAIYTGMGLPPVVVGLAVYLLFSRSGPLGSLGWLFTPWAMVVAQTVLAFPLVAGLTMVSLESLPPEMRLQIRSLGADRFQEVLALLGEARDGVMAALVAGLGGILSEVGAAMMVGGNIEGHTRVLTTAIVLETRRGEFGMALALGGILLSLAFAVNVVLLRLRYRWGPAWR